MMETWTPYLAAVPSGVYCGNPTVVAKVSELIVAVKADATKPDHSKCNDHVSRLSLELQAAKREILELRAQLTEATKPQVASLRIGNQTWQFGAISPP